MNEAFDNSRQRLVITDEGIEIYDSAKNQTMFYEYGNIKFIEIDLMGNFTVSDFSVTASYKAKGEEKKKIKLLLPNLKELNETAEKNKAQENFANKKFEKNLNDLVTYFGTLSNPKRQPIVDWLSNTLNSMPDDEEILFGCNSPIVSINPGGSSVIDAIIIISSKKFYFAGQNGRELVFVSSLVSGEINLMDTHAITSGRAAAWSGSFIKFETKNENYQFVVRGNDEKCIEQIKTKLNEAIEHSKKTRISENIFMQKSTASEIKEFKELLDMGIITQEEFDAKKKELLGL